MQGLVFCIPAIFSLSKVRVASCWVGVPTYIPLSLLLIALNISVVEINDTCVIIAQVFLAK
jgi:hypothetical protein